MDITNSKTEKLLSLAQNFFKHLHNAYVPSDDFPKKLFALRPFLPAANLKHARASLTQLAYLLMLEHGVTPNTGDQSAPLEELAQKYFSKRSSFKGVFYSYIQELEGERSSDAKRVIASYLGELHHFYTLVEVHINQ